MLWVFEQTLNQSCLFHLDIHNAWYVQLLFTIPTARPVFKSTSKTLGKILKLKT